MNAVPKSEAWLDLLFGLVEFTLNPSPGKFLGGYPRLEGSREFRRDLRRLTRCRLLQASGRPDAPKYRLTDLGRTHTYGGRDPFQRWARRWDGKWSVLVFDLPSRRQSTRVRLIRWLHTHHFGCLQRSVWIHPDPMGRLPAVTLEWAHNAGRVTFLEAACVAGSVNASVVDAAWNFAKINHSYENYLRLVGEAAALKRPASAGADALARWLRQERAAWLGAVSQDPLLPQALLPVGYLGQKAAVTRQSTLAAVGRLWMG